MPRPRVQDNRSDFRGGLNTAVSPDMLNANELVEATNARLTTQYSAIAKRTGTRRLHASAIGAGAPVRGLFQWDSPVGNQVVAIAGGKLYHKTSAFGEFTEIVPANLFSTTGPTIAVPFRTTAAGAALRLFLASANGNVYKFDGTTLMQIDGVQSVPNADLLIPYHTRMFYRDIDLRKHIFWSVIGDPEDARLGGPEDGGANIVDVLSGDEITAIQVIGSTLAIATNNSIVGFAGYSDEDIRVAQDTEGISSEIGVVGSLAFGIAEGIGVIVSDRGPYFVTEQSVQPIGVKVEPEFDALDRTILNQIIVAYHRGRREVWFALDNDVYIFSARLQTWSGPFTYPFSIHSLTRYEDAAGDEWLIAGCNDGFVRHMDIGALDDVLAGGAGGSAYTMTVELAPTFFEPGPGIRKSIDQMQLQADLPVGSALKVRHAFDSGSFVEESVTGLAGGVQDYTIPLDNQGKRLRLQFVDASSDIPIINGYSLYGFNMQRF